jgi:hypothetical protein
MGAAHGASGAGIFRLAVSTAAPESSGAVAPAPGAGYEKFFGIDALHVKLAQFLILCGANGIDFAKFRNAPETVGQPHGIAVAQQTGFHTAFESAENVVLLGASAFNDSACELQKAFFFRQPVDSNDTVKNG